MTSNVMTTSEVAEYLGFSNLNSVSTWAHRYGISPIYKQPGRKGVNVYSRAAVVEGKQRMLGRGIGGGRPRR